MYQVISSEEMTQYRSKANKLREGSSPATLIAK